MFWTNLGKTKTKWKNNIQFIVGPNTTYINPGLVFVAKQSIRGSASQSVLKYGQYIQTINLSDKQINTIKHQFPDFALNQFEQGDFGWIRPNLPPVDQFLHRYNKSYYKQAQLGASDLHVYPRYLWPENNYFFVESKQPKYDNIFKTPTKTILNDKLIRNITKQNTIKYRLI